VDNSSSVIKYLSKHEKMIQTAVQWLINQLDNNQDKTRQQLDYFVDKAKEMEKQQIKFFYDIGHLYSGCEYGFEECYNKTFEK
jgi:uncharacterized coiled-coil protein SlyX